jgi:hypothetical protein
VVAWLADALPPGGALLHVYEQLDADHRYVQINADAERFREGQIPSRFYLQLVREGADGAGGEVWRLYSPFALFAETISPDMVRVRTLAGPSPLDGWATSGRRTHDICDPSPLFEEPGFVQRVQDWLDSPDLAGRLARCAPPPLMMYPGRLTGDLPCATLSRIEIEDDGAVRLCPYAPVIGRVGDSLSELRDRASACLSQQERDADGGLRCPAARPLAGNGTGERAVQWLQLLSRVPFYVFDRLDSSQQT